MVDTCCCFDSRCIVFCFVAGNGWRSSSRWTVWECCWRVLLGWVALTRLAAIQWLPGAAKARALRRPPWPMLSHSYSACSASGHWSTPSGDCITFSETHNIPASLQAVSSPLQYIYIIIYNFKKIKFYENIRKVIYFYFKRILT